MKKFVSIILVFVLMFLVSCKKADLPDSRSEDAAEYSNLVDSGVQSELKETLLSCGVPQNAVDIFLKDVNEYHETVENTTLVQSGYKVFDLSPVTYDEDKLSELWNKKFPVFMGYNCKLTAFFLYKSFVRSNSVVSESENEMSMLFTLSPEKAQTHFSKADSDLFGTLYRTPKIKESMSQQECVEIIKNAWNEYGVTFDESDEIKLITVYTEDDYPEYHLEPVHAGLLFNGDERIFFLEKLSFVKPYQYSVFENEKDLYTYLKNSFGEDKKFFTVMKNAEVIE